MYIRYVFNRPPKNVKWVKDGSEPREVARVGVKQEENEVILTVSSTTHCSHIVGEDRVAQNRVQKRLFVQ